MPQREEQTKETEGNGTERGATGGGSKAVLCISRGILLQGRCLRAQLLLPSPAHSSQTWTRSAAALGKQKLGAVFSWVENPGDLHGGCTLWGPHG